MKTCPQCGEQFNWFRAITEYRQHVRACDIDSARQHRAYMEMNCRGCPAGCFKDVDYTDNEQHGNN